MAFMNCVLNHYSKTIQQVSFGKEETYLLFLSIKKLVEEKPLKSVRLWGKINGRKSNYVIVEGELKDGAIDDDEAAANEVSDKKKDEDIPKPAEGDKEGDQPTKNLEEDETGAPKPKTKPTKPLSKEARVGANKYVYYVCSFGILTL